ncbi:MAG: pilus assembly protein PilM, partial [Gallionella sp.]
MKIPLISSLFKAKTREAGWLAVGLARHGVYLVQVEFRGVRPRVVRCEYHETGAEPALQLTHIKRDAGLGAVVCTTLLAFGEYQMMLVNAPNVPDNELKAAVRWKIKDSLHYSIDDAAVDVLKIPANKNRPDRSQSLYAIAVPNEVIQKRISLFDQAGLELGVIDIPEAAQRNIAALFEQNDRGLAVLAFDEQGGLLTFT